MAEKEKAATAAGDEEEEVSDVDDSPLPALRRREAASDDDEEGDGGGVGGRGGSGSPPPSRVVGSDSAPDELGAAEVYGEDEGSEECEEVRKEFDAGSGGCGEAEGVAPDEVAVAPEDEEAQAETGAELEEEDKENKGFEPYAVPRTGAFYMHDDRFQNKENHSRGRQRDFFGGQKLWNSKDDSVWLHDRFDEINTHYVQHDSTRRPRSPFRAWAGGRTDGVNHGFLEGTKSASYYHDYRADYKYGSTNNYNGFPKEANTSYYNSKNYRSVPRNSHSYYDEKNFYNARTESRICYVSAKGYNNAPNVNRGKASRPYQPHWKNTFETSSVQNNRTNSRSQNEEGCSDTGVGKNSHRTLSLQNEQEFWSKKELPVIERRKARPDILIMKFSEQHPRGPDIPCTGMAFPGLLAHQPSDVSELSQITWLQTLSGTTGVLGATYDPSYIGSHYPQPSVFPRNHCATEVPILLNSPEIPEVVGHELGQRKNKLLRTSFQSVSELPHSALYCYSFQL